MSHRIAQIESTLKRVVSKVLATQLADPRVEGLVSITQIKVTSDLKTAFVQVSVLPESSQRKALKGLQHAAGRIRRLAADEIALAKMPHFEFRLDPGIKKQAAIERAIKEGMQRTEGSIRPLRPSCTPVDFAQGKLAKPRAATFPIPGTRKR